MTHRQSHFPYVIGSDGAGTVADVGSKVKGFSKGESVYAYAFMNPKGGFYAEYAAVKARDASHIPGNMTIEQAGALPCDGITALRGLEEVLGLESGESIMIFGASGGVGHLAVQLAKRMGARVLAVASGKDGCELARRLGADAVADGHRDDVLAAARQFAPEGLDCAIVTAGARSAQQSLAAVRQGGRIAFPNGVEPAPKAIAGTTAIGYDGKPTPQLIRRLNTLIEQAPFEVHVARTFPLRQAGKAHEALRGHYLGKLALRAN
jgi:NADPH:quinone reductase-like Zn-dependent oxidoreductase